MAMVKMTREKMAQVKMAKEKMALVIMAHGLVGKSVPRYFHNIPYAGTAPYAVFFNAVISYIYGYSRFICPNIRTLREYRWTIIIINAMLYVQIALPF